MTFMVEKGRCNVSDTRKRNMEFCFLRGLLFVALTARTLGEGKCFQQKGRNQTQPALACLFAS